MGKKDWQQIRHLQIQLSKAQETISELIAKNNQLDDEIYKLKLAGYGETSNIDQIATKAAQNRRELLDKLEAANNENQYMLSGLKNLGIIKGAEAKGVALIKDGKAITLSNDEASFVGFLVAFHDNEKEEILIYSGNGYYPGAPHTAQEKIGQMLFLEIHQTPLPDDIPKLDSLRGITKEILRSYKASMRQQNRNYLMKLSFLKFSKKIHLH